MLMSSKHPMNALSPLKLIGQISRTFARLVDAPLRDMGMAIGQMPVLVALKKKGALSQAELARLVHVEQPSMAQLLNRMERSGLVKRVLDPNDARRRLISLTTRAAKHLPGSKAIMERTCDSALDGLNDVEREQLLVLLERVNANLIQSLRDTQESRDT